MELVYLWVEKYKNIENQGFNFSPRFDCKYDKDSNELTIDENKDYVSIFPNNINVTAIVGENGSGKSSILEALVNLQSEDFNNISGFLIFKYHSELHILKNIKINSNYTIREYKAKKINFPYNSKILYLWMNANESFNIKHNENTQVILQSNSLFYQFKENDILNKHFELMEDIIKTNVLDKTYYFDSYEVILKSISVDFKKYWKQCDDPKNYELVELLENLLPRTTYDYDFKDILVHNYYLSSIRFYLLHWLEIIKQLGYDNFYNLFTKFIYKINSKIYLKKNYLFEETINFNLEMQNILNRESIIYPSISILILNSGYIRIILNNISLEETSESDLFNRSFSNIFKFTTEKDLISDMDTIKNFTNLEDENSIYNFFSIDLINSNTRNRYSNLSNGERQLLNISLDLIYSMKNSSSYGKNQVVIFDEADSFLHPKWSKELLYNIKNIIEEYTSQTNTQINIQLLFSTHSPFILSDLPKENIIFLENGKQKYPFKEKEQTFGANIHTLLSHGFFMEDGLMGEFAKGKIEDIIKFHKNVQKENINKEEKKDLYINDLKEKFWHIQSIIGDDYLKQVIKNHLIEIEKILLGNDEAKKEEITRLKAQIDLLEQE